MTCGTDTGCNGNCNQSRNCPNRQQPHAQLGNIAISGVIIAFFLLCLAWAGPGIDDNSAEATEADRAIAQLSRERKEAMAARAICGDNAAYQFNGNTLQCFTHRGAKTITAKVAP